MACAIISGVLQSPSDSAVQAGANSLGNMGRETLFLKICHLESKAQRFMPKRPIEGRLKEKNYSGRLIFRRGAKNDGGNN